MLWLVLSVLIIIVAIVSGVVFSGSTGETRETAGVVLGLSIVVWVLLSVALSVHTVGQRQVGIVYNFSGTITGKVDPGVAWTAPWQHIKKENVGLQKELFDLDPGNSAVSSDQQPIYAKVALNYEVEPSDVVNLFKTVGPAWKVTLLDSRVLQDFKEVTAGYSAQQITTSREKLRVETKTRLVAELAKYGVNVVDFFVTNIDYAQSYKDAISAKNVQVQKSLQADAKVAQATAEASQAVAKAKGEAEAIALKGKALRENPEILKLEAIDKLAPNAQIIYCSDIACPSILSGSLTTNGK